MNNTNTQQKFNFHTHTYRCKHATGDIKDYLKQASEQNASSIGFTEHPPMLEGIWTAYRMEEEELDGYFDAIKEARELFPGINVLGGFEMDIVKAFSSYYEDVILSRTDIDYLIGGVHWIKHNGSWIWLEEATSAAHLRSFVKETVDLMECGYCSFIAHPDSFGYGYMKWDENADACAADILSAAEQCKIPLEINGYGLRKKMVDTPEGKRHVYPLLPFWEKAAAYDIEVVYNSDAHKPENVLSSLDGCSEIADRFELKRFPVEQAILSTKLKTI